MVLSASEGGQALVTFLFDPLSTRESARVGAGRGTLPDGRGGPQGGASAIGHEGTVLTLPRKGKTWKGSLVSHQFGSEGLANAHFFCCEVSASFGPLDTKILCWKGSLQKTKHVVRDSYALDM